MTQKVVNIELPSDEDGFLPRQCPNCGGRFAIHGDTYEQEHYLNLRCPYCRWIEDFDEFLTDEQAAYGEAVAESELRRMMEKEIAEQWEDAFSGFSSSFIEVESNVDEIDFGDRSAPSPQLPIETDRLSCSTCGFPFAIRANEKDALCPVCR